jgi:hypothetical protein
LAILAKSAHEQVGVVPSGLGGQATSDATTLDGTTPMEARHLDSA